MSEGQLAAIMAGLGTMVGAAGAWFLKPRTGGINGKELAALADRITGAIARDGQLTRDTIKEEGNRSREEIRNFAQSVRAEIELGMLRAQQGR